MLTLLSVLSGILIAVMIAQNGGLASLHGTYPSAVIVHGIGLISILLWMLIKREKFHWDRSTHWPYYWGGALGVITVLLNNLSFEFLGISLTLSLGLLGQCLAGGIIDHFGFFNLPKRPFRKQHLLSFAFIVAGLALMML